MRTSPGFSLIELMAALAVVGLIALMLPRVSGAFTERASFDASVRTLAGALSDIRRQAVRERREVAMHFDLDGHRWRTVPGTRAGELPPGEVALLGIESGRGFDAAIAFFPDGGSSGGTLAVRSGTRAVEVAVDWMSGRITVRE